MLIKMEVLKKMSDAWEAELDALGANAAPDAYLMQWCKAPPISPSRTALKALILEKLAMMDKQ